MVLPLCLRGGGGGGRGGGGGARGDAERYRGDVQASRPVLIYLMDCCGRNKGMLNPCKPLHLKTVPAQ